MLRTTVQLPRALPKSPLGKLGQELPTLGHWKHGQTWQKKQDPIFTCVVLRVAKNNVYAHNIISLICIEGSISMKEMAGILYNFLIIYIL